MTYFEKKRLLKFARALSKLDPSEIFGVATLLKVSIVDSAKFDRSEDAIIKDIINAYGRANDNVKKNLLKIVCDAAGE